MNKNIKEVLSWVGIVALGVAAALLLNRYVIYKAIVPTGSMEKTIMPGDHVFGLRIFSDIKRGNIVIFPSEKYLGTDDGNYVKRVIGLPGEKLEISDGTVYVDGKALKEDYLPEEMYGDWGPYEVPEDCYFLLGDNRNGSGDARFWQVKYVEKDDIIAVVKFRYWPLNRLKFFGTPKYDRE